MRERSSSAAVVLSGLMLGLWTYRATPGWCPGSLRAIPSVDELLTRYSQTVDKCLHSFAVKSRSTMETYWKQSPDPRMPPGPDVLHTQDDFRYDGQRTRDISSRWGSIGVHGPTPENNPILRSEITEFLIAPDHAALKSFDLSDFPEGERVAYFENGRVLPVWYIWKNGRPVPDTPENRGR